MVGHVQEGTWIQAVVAALQQEEITFREFSDVISSLTPESIQVVGSLLRNWSDPEGEGEQRLSTARTYCFQLASATRVLS